MNPGYWCTTHVVLVAAVCSAFVQLRSPTSNQRWCSFDATVDYSHYSLLDGSAHRVWESALLKGRLPLESEFEDSIVWPKQPLFDDVCDVMVDLELPRAVWRHPSISTSVLWTLKRLSREFQDRVSARSDCEDEDDDDAIYDDTSFEGTTSIDSISIDVAATLLEEYGDTVSGIQSLRFDLWLS